MSTERDELAAMRGELAELTADAAERDDDDWMTEAADAILAAGYRKPRTITTTEELDALPVGSVVLRNGRAFQRYKLQPDVFGEFQEWKCADGGFVRSSKDGSSILPATVLHEGGRA